ncbi:YdeI/OmpD-associated family protein [Frankia sp. CcWB2]
MSSSPEPKATYFADPDEWRSWLEANHETAGEAWVGFYKKGAGRTGITWAQAVDEALCVGWIDGRRQRVDEQHYVIRFTRRKPGSVWSDVNRRRVAELRAEGRMRPAGEKALQDRSEAKAGSYSYEQNGDSVAFEPDQEQRLKADDAAWTFFQSQPASYRKAAIWWVTSAKKDQTRAKRFEQLLQDSANGRTVPPLTRRG